MDSKATAVIVIDMQVALFSGQTQRHDAPAVIGRINGLISAATQSGAGVVFIQHDGGPSESLAPGSEGWALLPELGRPDHSVVVRKGACDAFYETGLDAWLREHGYSRLIITGCATDFCVDTTVRAAAARDYETVVAADAHTTADRPHLAAPMIIQHHNWMWENLILPRAVVRLEKAGVLAAELKAGAAEAATT